MTNYLASLSRTVVFMQYLHLPRGSLGDWLCLSLQAPLWFWLCSLEGHWYTEFPAVRFLSRVLLCNLLWSWNWLTANFFANGSGLRSTSVGLCKHTSALREEGRRWSLLTSLIVLNKSSAWAHETFTESKTQGLSNAMADGATRTLRPSGVLWQAVPNRLAQAKSIKRM